MGFKKQTAESNLNRRAAWKQRDKQQLKVQIHNHAQWIPPKQSPVNTFFSEFQEGVNVALTFGRAGSILLP
jgi:hypothetical protein